MSRRTTIWCLASLSLALLAGCGGGATGQAPTTTLTPSSAAVSDGAAVLTGPVAREATPEEQLQSDRDAIRQFYPDMTDQEADAYNAASQATGQLLYVVEAEHSESFAWAVVEDSKVYSSVVHFKNASPETLALVTSAGIPGVSVDNTAKYTKVEQGQLTAVPFQAVADRGMTRSVTASYDWERDVVTVDVAPKAGVDLATVVAGAPSQVALPGVLDAEGRPTLTPVTYVESGTVLVG